MLLDRLITSIATCNRLFSWFCSGAKIKQLYDSWTAGKDYFRHSQIKSNVNLITRKYCFIFVSSTLLSDFLQVKLRIPSKWKVPNIKGFFSRIFLLYSSFNIKECMENFFFRLHRPASMKPEYFKRLNFRKDYRCATRILTMMEIWNFLEEWKNVVYRIPCKDCPWIYFG